MEVNTSFQSIISALLTLIAAYAVASFVWFNYNRNRNRRRQKGTTNHNHNPNHNRNRNQSAFDFFEKHLKSPKLIMAPMVLQSELPFRMMGRKYGAQLCYSPMLRAKEIIETYNKYGNINAQIRTTIDDRPLVIQLCSHNTDEIVSAASIIEKLQICDAIDLNLGCPQRSAKRDNFGAFLLTQPRIIENMITALVSNISIPIFAKIRILPTIYETLSIIDLLERSGVSLITIHGRRRERMYHKSPADLDTIAQIKKIATVPIIANGNIRNYNDIRLNLRITECDGLMSATGLLSNPYLFDTEMSAKMSGKYIEMCREYLSFVATYPPPNIKSVNDHILEFCKPILSDSNGDNGDLRKLLLNFEKINTIPQIEAIINILEYRQSQKSNSNQLSLQTTLPSLYTISEIRRNDLKHRQYDSDDERTAVNRIFATDDTSDESNTDD